MEEIEVDESQLLELLDELDDVPVRQPDAGLRLLSGLELPLQFQQLRVHLYPISERRTQEEEEEEEEQ